MHRVISTGFTAGLAITCLFAMGCASQPSAAPASNYASAAPATASVDAGPPACEAIHARIHRSEGRVSAEGGTWLDAPARMVNSRRLRALHARADRLGCSLPRI